MLLLRALSRQYVSRIARPTSASSEEDQQAAEVSFLVAPRPRRPTRAGERAKRTGASATATAAYLRAADLLADTHTTESELSSAGLCERAGRTADAAGEFGVAVEHYRRAAELYRRHGRDRDAARADTGAGTELL